MEVLEIGSKFEERKKDAANLGCSSLDSLLLNIETYESKGFNYDPRYDQKTGADIPAVKTPAGGNLTIPEAEMILQRPIVGNIRHREALDSLAYIKLKVLYLELTGSDNHIIYSPKKGKI